MHGDQLVIEAHHVKAAEGILALLGPALSQGDRKQVLTIAGESGSGKSETAAALRDCLADQGIEAVIFQQDDYFVHPPHSNDRARRQDIDWVGPGEVRLALLDQHLAAFKRGEAEIDKPLVIYAEDRIDSETLKLESARIAIAEGTYTSLLEQADWRVFIDRTLEQTRAHREKRRRHDSELDPFIDRVLAIEHEIIRQHRDRADLIVHADYSVSCVEDGA
ncbi:uridine kinase family protein [Wenzhouxiangella marina]|uniref:Uncharacterized protein n=1 Tax=Wenzhouxiangella marina TaxID=1579979 RepID=A0A0K0XU23_9GAMM|nr:zeta toxin family protein [Wenzhouxiangella marina]AKS41127.1 hypothetical protein WM2015_746 [Wenzhouxiangella marina]MBB6088006.1 uridine kinase [Wenzhouxiangella marina]